MGLCSNLRICELLFKSECFLQVEWLLLALPGEQEMICFFFWLLLSWFFDLYKWRMLWMSVCLSFWSQNACWIHAWGFLDTVKMLEIKKGKLHLSILATFEVNILPVLPIASQMDGRAHFFQVICCVVIFSVNFPMACSAAILSVPFPSPCSSPNAAD